MPLWGRALPGGGRGAPASVFVAFDEAAVEVTQGQITKFSSSPGVHRGFCSRCGATLTCEGPAKPGELHIHIGAFDRAAELQPAFHIFPEERLPWMPAAQPRKA